MTSSRDYQKKKSKAEKLDHWSTLDIHRWSDYPDVNDAVDAIYLLMQRLNLPHGKSNVRKRRKK